VARRQIAPFLWQRGNRRIVEVFISHADLDHFNGLPELLRRFAVGQVTYTPSFSQKATRGVHETLDALRRQGVPVRIARAGDRFTAGEVEIEVLHPPALVPAGPKENENSRSLVLRLEHEGHTLLLTGDLVGLGIERVTGLPGRRVDVLMAPHHGSPAASPSELARWAQPRVVVSSQEQPQDPEPETAARYREQGATFLATWAHGAVTVRSRPGTLDVETFVTGLRLALEGAPGD
jgi:competence protein ComEC